MATPIPLRYRAPNPPAPLVGRSRELDRLNAARDVARVILVTGPSGVGKTALVLEHLAATGGDERQVFVELRMGDGATTQNVREQAIAALTAAHGAAAQPTGVPPGADARGAWLIDIAETGPFTVVLDGLEADQAGAQALLDQLARYSRESRWICTSRSLSPAPASGVVTVPVAPLEDAAARALADALADAHGRPRHAAEAAAEHAFGSPRRVRDLLLGRAPDAHREADLLLSPGLVGGARLLAESDNPLPRPLVERFVDDDGLLDRAIARGLLYDAGAGRIGAHPIVGATVRDDAGTASPEERLAWVDALRSQPDPVAQLEALRHALALGSAERASAILEASGATLIHAGHGAALWALLDPVTDVALSAWRDLVAVDAGALDALDDDAMRGADLAHQVARARMFGLRGRHAEAQRAAHDALEAARAAGDAEMQTRAGLILAASMQNESRHDESLAVLESLAPETLWDRLSLDGLVGCALSYLGREDEGRVVVRAAFDRARREGIARLPLSVRSRLAAGCCDLDERALAWALLAPERDGPEPATMLPVRVALVQCAVLALDDGRLDDVETLLQRLGPSGPSPTYIDAHVDVLRIERMVGRGDLARARALAEDARGRVQRGIDDAFLTLYLIAADLLEGRPAPADRAPTMADAMTMWELEAARHALRWRPQAWTTLPRWTDTKRRTRRGFPLRLRAEHALLAGELTVATRDAERALQEAQTHGYRLLAGELMHLLCDVHLIAGRWEDVAAMASAMAALGETCAAPRLVAEAAFYGALEGAGGRIDWAALERMAAAPEPGAVGARRARALLEGDGATAVDGDDVPAVGGIDRLDALVLEAIRRDHRPVRVRALRHTPEPPRWGIDAGRRDAWSEGGRWLELPADGVGWRILACLARMAGRATNEELVAEVWGIDKYRPHLHDNRLHVAIYKLRRAATTDDGEADHIIREGDGYVLAGRCALVEELVDV